MTPSDGYRRAPRGGPAIRSDIVDVYVFRAPDDDPTAVEFLQVLRNGPPLDHTWQPVMGHVEEGETAVHAAVREAAEEIGLRAGEPHWLAMWALEQVHPYYLADLDCIVMSPRFAVRVAPGFKPALNDEHADHRWVPIGGVPTHFMWPGQKAACREIIEELLRPGSLAERRLRIETP
ncbi:MAG: NUDIX domain-containing protein [Planctomycetota bacterium]|nr:NUDIX domain-containing protein [Planctomycetota bacterium]